MMGYISQRLLLGLASMLAVISIISTIIYLAPVDIASLQYGQQNNKEAIAAFKTKNHLDKPLYQQVYLYMLDLSPIQFINKSDSRLQHYQFHGLFDLENTTLILKWPYFRESFVNGAPIKELINSTLPRTLILGFAAMIIGLILGLILGMIAALKKGSKTDYFLQYLCTLIYAVPSYVSAIILSLIFGFLLFEITKLPVQGGLVQYNDLGELEYHWKNLILPSLALGLRPVSQLFLMTRASITEAMQHEFVRTARSKGLNEFKILIKHVFPNSFNPILTTISSWFASMLTGAFFVEYVFNYRGMGDLTIQALHQFDVPVILACSVVTVLIFIITSILTDILYSVNDPRIKI